LQNVFEGLNVNVDCIGQNVQEFMPNAVLERAMMILVERGEDRQKVHSKIRQIALGEEGKNAEMIANSLKEVNH
jgi:adenylosuccinate lyase